MSQRSALLLATMCVFACSTSETDSDSLMFLNGLVLTGPDSGAVSSVIVRDGYIEGVGDPAALAGLLETPSVVVDLEGRVLAPALVDHHVHLINVGLALLNADQGERLFLDVSDVTSLTDLEQRIRLRAASAAPGTWIVGAGWSQASWGSHALPTHQTLTRAAPNHPVFLARSDGHAGWANAAAMRVANLDTATVDPPGGAIVRSRDGGPTGVLLERANELLIEHIPAPSDNDVRLAFRLAADALAARGVTDVYDAGVLAFPGVVALNIDLGRYLELLREVDAQEPLPITVNLMIPAPSRLADSVTISEPFQAALSARVRITHLKLFADGALGSRGAALTHPYADDSTTTGVPRMTAADIYSWARRALDAGLGVATHAIGDEAVRRTLDTYDRLLTEEPELDAGRLRIEHFSYARAEDFERAVQLGVVLSIQSTFNSPPGETPSFGEHRVGLTGGERVYAWKTLAEMGARLAEGSDYFGLPGPPLLGFHAALTRQHGIGESSTRAMARGSALELSTTWFEPEGGAARTRVVRPGEPANLVVLTADPLSISEDSLLGVRVLASVRDGAIVYDGGLGVGAVRPARQ